jgi:hypothetical protein
MVYEGIGYRNVGAERRMSKFHERPILIVNVERFAYAIIIWLHRRKSVPGRTNWE